MRLPKLVIKPLPKSWWSIYTEALLNSRGQKTEAQVWREQIRRNFELMRQFEDAIWSAQPKPTNPCQFQSSWSQK